MASIGKISSSFLSIPNELTVAAASLNFDFSLVKIEAPKEFHGVRDALSKFRRNEAETGIPHITARKLGALFEPLVPLIPNLLAAYGERVSEISSKMSSDQSRQSASDFGIFASQAGPDATNIWAAATSGKSALAVHLLACMIARMWKEHEAISLWVELIDHRKTEVNNQAAEGANLSALMAAQQTFTREQLATWDSSARSWIQTADAAKRLQQTQLMLIMSNLELPVNSCTSLYESVTKAWISAMTAMERLVQGVPQQIRDGATLLAISAWHLYPNMVVLSNTMRPVTQNDPLMQGALLTVAVHTVPTEGGSSGVFWSLPMAHMRFYSPPVTALRRFGPDTSRIPMHEFLIVILGMMISPWMGTFCPDPVRCCRLIIRVDGVMKNLSGNSASSKEKKASLPTDLDWLSLLSGAASRYLDSTGIISQQLTKLLGLGIRSRGEPFLDTGNLGNGPQESGFAFGLSEYGNLLSLITEQDMEANIEFLRRVGGSLKGIQGQMIIKYSPRWDWAVERDETGARKININPWKTGRPRSPQLPRQGMALKEDQYSPTDFSVEEYRRPGQMGYEFASVLHHRRSGQKRSADGTSHAVQGHRRWALGRQAELDHYDILSCSASDCGCLEANGTPCFCEDNGVACTQACHPGGTKCAHYEIYDPFLTQHESTDICGPDSDCAQCHNLARKRRIELAAPGEELTWVSTTDILEAGYHRFVWNNERDDESTSFRFLLGDHDNCAIYESEEPILGKPGVNNSERGRQATVDEVEAMLESKIMEPEHLYTCLVRWMRSSSQAHALEALIFANALYQHLDGATVNLEVIRFPLAAMEWPRWCYRPEDRLPGIFACLAFFESGQYLVDPAMLRGVTAMSSHDSIFVASALVSDPSDDVSEQPIRRVFGNMGRSEMTFLISPANPALKKADLSSWNLINHASFDGQFVDSFSGTSLHLSFTDYEMPIDLGGRGLRDRQAVLLESIITLNDKGKDLGDVDLLSIFTSDVVEFTDALSCSHKVEDNNTPIPRDHPLVSAGVLTNLDCWDELLDPPSTTTGIFRATGNWQARIAAAAVCRQMGKRVLILPGKPCLQCIESQHFHHIKLKEFDVVIA